MNIKLRPSLLPFLIMVISVFAAPRYAGAQTCGIYPKTFTYTGTVQTYTVPAGVTSIRVDAWGASGGSSGDIADAGKGARVQATLAVSPGQVLKVLVGGAGQYTGLHNAYLNMMPGGYNGGGGNTGWSFTSTGGGATDLRSSGGTLADRLVVAGGGGGGHFNGYVGGDGGAPTGGDGDNGNANAIYYANSWGGSGATDSTGFALGQGGKGDCGGGGGYWGGKGSNGAGFTGTSGGGGGGSSWVTPSGSSAITMTASANAAFENVNTPTYNSGHGRLTITPGTLVIVPAPTITSFTPTSGPLGTSVVLTGTGLGCATAVAFNGMAAPGFSASTDGTTLTATVPDDWWATTGPITVTAPSGTATSANTFTITRVTSPRLISLSPTSGPAGTSVIITGDYFTAATSVSFNGTAATTYTVNSATQITATVPAGATSGNVLLSTVGACCSSIGVPFTVFPPPAITSLSPASGTAGTSVTITGTDFTGATGVTFNGTAATSFTVNSATQITAIVPAVASGNVVVTTANGTSNGVFFTVTGPYITSISSGSGNIGTRASISGNFPGNCKVIVNNANASIFGEPSATYIVFSIPGGAVSGANTVVVRDNNNLVSNSVTLTVPSPAITSISPNNGPVGTSITITGGNFGAGSTVAVGGVSASIASSSTTKIVATVPATLSAGANPVVVSNNGFASNSVAFTVTSLAISGLSPSSGAVGTSVIITGTNFTGATAVTFNGTAATGFTVNSGTQITATVPAGAATGDVTVTTASGTSEGISFAVLATPAITFADISKTFGDAGFNLAATSNSSGAITYSVVSGTGVTVSASGEVIITGAGSVQIKATQAANGNYSSGEKTIALTIQKAPATITLTAADLTQTYSGSGKAVGYSINPVGVTGISVAYSQGSNAVALPTLAGSYSVEASLANNNYTATNVTGTLIITAPTPGITGLSPSSGPVGTSVVITGTNFSGATGVAFNGTAATSFTVNSATQITAIVPNGATIGNVVVSHAGETSNGVHFEVIYPPTITRLSKYWGLVGSVVTITGTNFTRTTGVKFDYTAATYTVVSDTQITAVVPLAGYLRVVVTNPAGTSKEWDYEAIDQSTITSLSPGRGAEGSPVSIIGTHLDGTYLVTLNGKSVDYYAASASEITIKVPAGATSGNMVVYTVKGMAGATSNEMPFEVIPDVPTLSPGNGAVGTAVTIRGAYVDKAYQVTFNGVTADYEINYIDYKTKEITAIVPAGATSGDVVVYYADERIAWKSTGIYWKSTGVYFTVSAIPTITFADINKTYGDVAFNLAATSNSSGAITYSVVSGTGATVSASGEVTITGTGSVQIRATQAANGNYTDGEKTITLTIQKASATITLTAADLTQTYNGNGKAVGYTTNPAGVTGVNVTYSQNGNAVGSPTAAGTYSVLASLTNDNYLPTSATGNLVIGKAAATVALGNLTPTYTGSPLAATATTNPTGLTVNLTYNSAAQAPTASGSYAVGGIINDDNYTGSASGTLVIGKAPSVTTVTITGAPFTYTGAAQTPATVSVSGAGGLSLAPGAAYTNNTAAGRATASYTYTGDANHTGSNDSEDFIIGKATSTTVVTVPAGPYTYTGLAHTPASVTVTGAGGLSLTPTAGYANNTAAGTATASYSYAGDANHEASSGSKTFAIGKKAATVTPADNSKTYGASEPVLTGAITGFILADNITAAYSRVAGETVLGGPYTISATLSPAAVLANYDITYNTADFSIGKAALNIVNTSRSKVYGVTIGNTDFAGNITGVAAGDNITVTRNSTGEGATATVAGSAYPITATIVDPANRIDNYSVSNPDGLLTVAPAPINIVAANQSKIYGSVFSFLGTEFTVAYGALVNGNKINSVSLTSAGAAQLAAVTTTGGEYPIVPSNAVGTGLENYSITYVNGKFTVSKMAVVLEYTGTEFLNTANASTSKATVPIGVKLSTGTAGVDFSTAKVYFTVTPNATIVNCESATTFGSDSKGTYLKVAAGGTASACLNVDLGSNNSTTYQINFTVDGNFQSTPNEVLVTVSKPLGDFITGGGHLKHPTVATSTVLPSAGKYRADAGSRTNFSFNVKFNKSGTSLQGGMNIITRSGGRVYQYKTNSLTYLGVKINDPSVIRTDGKYGSSATFTAKATVTDITNPSLPISLGGGLNVIVTMKDKGDPGKENDMIAITIKDGDILLFSSNWDAAKLQTGERVISAGNLSANSSSNVGTTNTTIAPTQPAKSSIAESELVSGKFEIKAFPNPSATHFNVQLLSINTTDKITLRVLDVNGRNLRVLSNLTAGQTVQLGSGYRPGIYYVEMLQGNNRSQMKLVKGSD